jgi:GNAT superfamily N-acetyltransferase
MIEVRLAQRADAELVGTVIDAMDRHYRGQDAVKPAGEAAAMIARTIDSAEGTRFLIAFQEGEPVGLACFAVIRPGRGQAGLIFLKDLFVVEGARSKGVGKRLISALAHFAEANGIGRIDLTTEPDNAGAQKLYAELGGKVRPTLKYTFEGETLARLANP